MRGPELTSLRKAKGQTQLTTARLLCTTPCTVARWERNERSISPLSAKAIHQTLDPLPTVHRTAPAQVAFHFRSPRTHTATRTLQKV